MDLQLHGKTALVLGGSKGLGRGVAQALAGEGVRVAVVARSKDAIDRTIGEITAKGGAAIGLGADLGEYAAVERAAAAARERLGPIDILLNNSGGPLPSGVLEVGAELWEAQFRAMVLSLFRLTAALLPEMRVRKWGRVINIASHSVIEPIPGLAISNTLRGAIAGWAKTLAGEVARDGITVNTLLPGAIATDRSLQLSRATAERLGISADEAMKRTAQAIPVGRLGTPEEFGAVAAFIASPLAAYITGSLIRVDGGAIRAV